MKPKVAFFDFASCEGCQLQVANLEEDILKVVDKLDVVSFREVMKEHSDDYDIAFIEGSIQRPMDETRLKQIRARAKILIAMGACACNGGVNKLRNNFPIADSKREVYGRANIDKNPLFDVHGTKAVDEVVKVDFYIRGCPVRKEQILYYVKRFDTMPPHRNLDLRFGITEKGRSLDERFAIQYNPNKCIMCRRCDYTCNDALGVHAISVAEKGAESVIATPFGMGLEKNNCIACGQCITVCPVGAFYEESQVERALDLLDDPSNFVVFVLDPVALTSCIDQITADGADMGQVIRKTISALKSMNAEKVVNYTPFIYLSSAAQAEFLSKNKGPVFTSWCPSTHLYVQKFFPNLVKHLHPESSPEKILVKSLRERFAGENLKIVLITPCITHRLNPDFDAVLTARELPRLFKYRDVQVDFQPSLGVKFDLDLGMVDKFVTGGCSDYTCSLSIMRAAYLDMYRNLDAALSVVTHDDYIHELVFDSEEGFLNALVIEDMGRAPEYLGKDIGKYRIIELYPCYKGCLSGGGQVPTVSMDEIDRRRDLLKSYKGEVESPFEFTSQITAAFARLKGGE